MNKSGSSEVRWGAWHTCSKLVFVAIFASWAGCQPRDADVVGTYTRAGKIANERLLLKTDHTYVHEIVYTNGGRYLSTNTWLLVKGVVDFSNFQCAFDDQSGDEQFPPRLFTLTSLEIQPDVLIGDYERNYYFRRVNLKSD
jgi:hypothetical protein